jgi:pimeloyl-ACP methyl ester carboxylesterase
MKPTLLLAATLLTGLATAPALASESDITLKTPTGTIYGTLTLADKSPSPVVLIIAGSGPTDRDGNSPQFGVKTDAYKMIAAALAKRGVSSVRYDKRGIAASAAAMQSEASLRFDDYVNDAVAWVNLLAGDKRFSRVTIAGHSEGSLIGMIAAQRSPVSAYVSLDGAGFPAATVLRTQFKQNAALYAKADPILTQLEQGHTVSDIPADMIPYFHASVQPYLISWFKYDPAIEIAKLKIPVTIVQGSADVQISTADEDALRSAAKGATDRNVDGMNHVLKFAPNVKSPIEIQKGYTDPTLPVMPDVIDAIYNAARL